MPSKKGSFTEEAWKRGGLPESLWELNDVTGARRKLAKRHAVPRKGSRDSWIALKPSHSCKSGFLQSGLNEFIQAIYPCGLCFSNFSNPHCESEPPPFPPFSFFNNKVNPSPQMSTSGLLGLFFPRPTILDGCHHKDRHLCRFLTFTDQSSQPPDHRLSSPG